VGCSLATDRNRSRERRSDSAVIGALCWRVKIGRKAVTASKSGLSSTAEPQIRVGLG
jgi:hypothetical protein